MSWIAEPASPTLSNITTARMEKPNATRRNEPAGDRRKHEDAFQNASRGRSPIDRTYRPDLRLLQTPRPRGLDRLKFGLSNSLRILRNRRVLSNVRLPSPVIRKVPGTEVRQFIDHFVERILPRQIIRLYGQEASTVLVL